MCAAISNWYTSQYGSWNRTRRLQVPPFVATETNVTPTPPGITAADALILNMNEVDNIIGSSNRPAGESSKKADTLFGPGVGIIPSGPTWADSPAPKKDEISSDVVKTWVNKSKDTSIPTTTLQALVNLKRPSIKLSPLSPSSDTAESAPHIQHGLEFEFDCDAPKCGITMFVINQIDTANRLLLFESVVDGGFGRFLKYDEGAILELAHLESVCDESRSSPSRSIPGLLAEPSGAADQTDQPATSSHDQNNQPSTRNKKRFSHFAFRKRSDAIQQVTGPALPVVDADASNTTSNEMDNGSVNASPSSEQTKTKEENGIKVVIEIEALDQEGTTLSSRNSQLTYLHIVRMGASVEEEDRRPWMVKVVKREARIGTHVFHLHEIYGLSSTTTVSSQLPIVAHSYPPTEQANDDQTSECLLCLSSPREVVLLPCRHLVACRECAINMVEFGAGGSLVHTEAEASAAPATTSATAAGEQSTTPAGGTDTNVTTVTATPPAPAPSRRKRKAKGWFCPVCRQPYTSLLRITATPPEKEVIGPPSPEETGDAGDASTPSAPEPAAGLDVRSLFPRPNFFRSLSRPGSRPNTANASNMV